MAGIATALGILMVIVAIPFGLMIAPLALGVVIAFLGWRHVAASLEIPSSETTGTAAG